MTTVPHIFTLTGNLLAERTLEFEQWSPGRTQRAGRESFQVGGKGINVGKMLTRLGAPNTALCFAGGAAGAECEAWLRARGFAYRSFPTLTPTRTGTVVRRIGEQETTFLAPDVPPDDEAVRTCAGFLDAQPSGQVLALCGSFPGWQERGFNPLRAALVRWLERGHLVVDTYGPALVWLAERPVDLVKINSDELRLLMPSSTSDLPAKVRRWAITDGPRAVKLRDADGTTSTLMPPVVREVSAVGSGDVLLAGILYALYCRAMSLDAAVRLALPYAAANAAHLGVAEFPDPAK